VLSKYERLPTKAQKTRPEGTSECAPSARKGYGENTEMDTLAICPSCEALNRVPLARAEQAQPVCGRCKTELPLHDGIQEVNGSSLGVLIKKSSRPVVVDFWAPWCGPCRAFAPTYQQAARELAGKMVLAKLNTEAHPIAGDTYQIRGIPTLAVFVNGVEVDRRSGAMPLPSLRAYLRQFDREESQ
jgi:thioredoxin 2